MYQIDTGIRNIALVNGSRVHVSSTITPPESAEDDTQAIPAEQWFECCLGLVDAPSLAEIEHRLDRVLAELCRPQRWTITFDVDTETDEVRQAGTSHAPGTQHSLTLRLPLLIRGRDHGTLEIVPAPDYPIAPEVMPRLQSLARSLAIGLHRLHQEMHLRSHIGDLAFVQSLLHEHLPSSRAESRNPFSQAMLGLLGGSSFGCIIPLPNIEDGYRVYSTRRASATLSAEQRRRMMRLVHDRFKGSHQGQSFYLIELDELRQVAETYRLSYLSQLASLAIVPIHTGTSLLGTLILGEERDPAQRPMARQAIVAAINLARSMAQAITRDGVLRMLLDHGPFMRTLIDELDDAVLTAEQGLITSWNRAAGEVFGYRADEVLGKPILEILHAAPTGLIERSTGTSATTARQTFEWKLRTASGRDLLLDCMVSTLEHHHTGAPVVMYVFREVSRERELEHLKDELLTGISHELRTPLNNITTFVQLLQQRPDLPDQVRTESLQLVQTSSEELHRMFEDFIDVARSRRSHLPVTLAPLELGPLIRSNIQRIRPRFGQHTIKAKIEDDLPLVNADRLRIQQILDNLISNAAAYSAEGTRITVHARRNEQGIDVCVTDQGIGMTPEVQERIFEPFYRAENARHLRAKGVGLGLSIVRSLVEAHGGALKVQSVVERGTTFMFSLPIYSAEGTGA